MAHVPRLHSQFRVVAVADNVRCIDCGFLSFYEQFESHNVVGVTRKYRDSGEMPEPRFIPSKGERNPYDNCPVCFVDACHLRQQANGDSWKDGYEVAIRNRSCDDFEPYVPGLNPREHIDVIQTRNAHAMQLERDIADRQWREKMAEREHQWRNEDLEKARGWRNEDRSLAKTNLVVTALVAIVSTIATLLAAKLLPWFR